MTGPTPWRQWLKLAFGVLGLTPDVFWRMSMREFSAAVDGRNDQNIRASGKLTADDCRDLRQWIKATKEKYPDGTG